MDDERFHRLSLGESLGPLGDVHGVVSDSLQVVVDLERTDEKTQVHRYGLLQGEERHRLLLDDALHPVDRLVVPDDRSRFFGIDLGERFDRALDLALDLASHEDQVPAQVLELFREMLLHGPYSAPFALRACGGRVKPA
jgi:hypothetical protein